MATSGSVFNGRVDLLGLGDIEIGALEAPLYNLARR